MNWPSIIFQDDSNMLQEILLNTTTPGNDGGWSHSAVDVNGLSNSGLADVPLTANGNFGVNLFYDRNDQSMLKEILYNGSDRTVLGNVPIS
jgi:hypothetical protein